MLTRLDIKALLFGVSAYAGTYVLLVLLISFVMNTASQAVPWTAVTIGFLFVMSIGGFVAGYKAGHSGWLHGIVVAMAGAVALSLGINLMMPGFLGRETFMAFLVMGGFLNAGSGWLGELKRNAIGNR